jgi:predicted nucleotidyltransferase
MKSRKELVNKLMEDYCTENSVLGVIQVGSTAKGYDDEFSDVDLEVVVSDERYVVLEKSFQKFIHDDKYDLIFTTVVRLEDVINSESDEDHWNYEKSVVLLDKTGKVGKILGKITRYGRFKDNTVEAVLSRILEQHSRLLQLSKA